MYVVVWGIGMWCVNAVCEGVCGSFRVHVCGGVQQTYNVKYMGGACGRVEVCVKVYAKERRCVHVCGGV